MTNSGVTAIKPKRIINPVHPIQYTRKHNAPISITPPIMPPMFCITFLFDCFVVFISNPIVLSLFAPTLSVLLRFNVLVVDYKSSRIHPIQLALFVYYCFTTVLIVDGSRYFLYTLWYSTSKRE